MPFTKTSVTATKRMNLGQVEAGGENRELQYLSREQEVTENRSAEAREEIRRSKTSDEKSGRTGTKRRGKCKNSRLVWGIHCRDKKPYIPQSTLGNTEVF